MYRSEDIASLQWQGARNKCKHDHKKDASTRMMDTFPVWMVFFNSLKAATVDMCFCKTHNMAVIHDVLVRQYMLDVQVPGHNI